MADLDDEWYTPPKYVEAVRAVLGGIDLDPASHVMANDVVRAARYYTIDDDGLAQQWVGRVFMYPPHERYTIPKFCTKFTQEFEAGRITEAIVLVNNSTGATWAQPLLRLSSAICFPRGRIIFRHPENKKSNPVQGQMFLYFGPAAGVIRFAERFAEFGMVWRGSWV